MRYAQIAGWGMHVPSRLVKNERFVELGLDTSDEWIATRTGIRQRYIAGNESTSDLALRAAQEALYVSGTHARDIDLILLATCTPDQVMPSTASLIQDRIGATGAGAMDLNAACAGFVYALAMGAGQIESGRARQVLVIGADELSTHLNWRDRSTCVLFGDGAGAVVLKESDEPGILSSTTGCDGAGADLLMIPAARPNSRANGHSPKGVGYLTMNGPQIFRWATQMMAKAAEKVITASGLKLEQVDLFIPHQANLRIMETTAKRLGLPLEKVFSNVRQYGNTSAASIPIALYEAVAAGRLKGGDNVVLSSFGAGLSWAAVALRWGANVPAQHTRWSPLRRELEARMAAVRSTLRRQERAVRATIGERLRRDGD
ncbi:MAG: beta-ketoacyl-ACP synthase III [Dehalococcoidia bacterium]|nr:beta-ketoacyl-ACP synthase III [Dehalococcoidia bacterium]